MISRSFQRVRRMREAWKWKHMFGLSHFRPSRQSNISTSGEERFKYPLPWENKINQMPYQRANKDNEIPTSCPAFPHRHNIDRCIKRTIGNTGVTDHIMLFLTTGMSRFFAKFPFLPPPSPSPFCACHAG